MSVFFPYAFADLATEGKIPADGDAVEHVQASHFNRLHQEVTAVESTLGPNPAGSVADVKTRLAVSMGDEGLAYGALQGELVCDDDPSGGDRGTTRYLDAQGQGINFPGVGVPVIQRSRIIRLAYTLWEQPCALFWTLNTTSTASELHGRTGLLAHSEVAARVFFANHDGTWSVNDVGGTLYWLALSSELRIWEDDRAWMLPPTRVGGR